MAAQSQAVIKTHHSRVIDHVPFFYGWVILLLGALAIIAAAPGLGFSLSLFIDHYIAEFGISRTTLSLMNGVATVVAGLGVSWVGKQIDRRGSRVVGVWVGVAFVGILVLTSAIANILMLFISLWALRLMGISMHVLGSTVIARWWQSRRGMMIGLSLVAAAMFRGQYLPVLQGLIERYGWRETWIILGVTLGVVVLPVWACFMRDKPEAFGLLPDGGQPRNHVGNAKKLERRCLGGVGDDCDWSLAQAQRTLIFWVFASIRATGGIIGAGLVFHQVSIFAQVGHSESVMAAVFGWVSWISIGMTLFVGWLIQRVRPGIVMAMQLVFMIGVMLLIPMMTQTWMLIVYAIVFGAVWGFGGTIDGTVWADMFGRQYLGEIQGFTTTIQMIGMAIGPVVYAISYDFFGSYLPVAVGGVLLLGVEIVLVLAVKPPQSRPEIAPTVT